MFATILFWITPMCVGGGTNAIIRTGSRNRKPDSRAATNASSTRGHYLSLDSIRSTIFSIGGREIEKGTASDFHLFIFFLSTSRRRALGGSTAPSHHRPPILSHNVASAISSLRCCTDGNGRVHAEILYLPKCDSLWPFRNAGDLAIVVYWEIYRFFSGRENPGLS